LGSISGDDANCFGVGKGGYFNPQNASLSKKELLERLDWEMTTPETPDCIKKRAKATHEAVSALNWTNEEGFGQAYDTWSQFKKWVEELLKEKPELKEAMTYKIRVFPSKQWDIFFFGEPQLPDEFY